MFMIQLHTFSSCDYPFEIRRVTVAKVSADQLVMMWMLPKLASLVDLLRAMNTDVSDRGARTKPNSIIISSNVMWIFQRV